MAGPQGCYAKQNKPEKDKYCMISLTCGIQKHRTCSRLFCWGRFMQALWAQAGANWSTREREAHLEQWTTLAGPVLAPSSPGHCFQMEDSLESPPFIASLLAPPKGAAYQVQTPSKPYIFWLRFYCFNFFPCTPLIITPPPSVGFLTHNLSLFLLFPWDDLLTLKIFSIVKASLSFIPLLLLQFLTLSHVDNFSEGIYQR